MLTSFAGVSLWKGDVQLLSWQESGSVSKNPLARGRAGPNSFELFRVLYLNEARTCTGNCAGVRVTNPLGVVCVALKHDPRVSQLPHT